MEGIGRGGLEVGKMPIERAIRIGLGVDEERASADGVGGLRRAEQHFLQQRPAQSASLFAEVDAESREQDDRNRVTAGPSVDAWWSVGRLDRGGGEREVGDYSPTIGRAHHVDDGRLGSLGLEGVHSRATRDARRERGDVFGHPPYGYQRGRDSGGRVTFVRDPRQPIEPVLDAAGDRAAEVEAEPAKLADQESLVDVPAIDWNWPRPELNAVLRALWERVELDGAMRPVCAVWTVPEWRTA